MGSIMTDREETLDKMREQERREQERPAPRVEPRREVQARRFYLQRDSDVTGTSGTGKVAEGVQFSGGRVALTWHSHFGTVAVYDNMAVVEHLHGHDGATRVVWVDEAGR
jgi:hypothetical protein